jgi:hypothetical protein
MKIFNQCFAFALVCLIFFTSCEKLGKGKQATIYGIITDYKTLEPLQGVKVMMYSGNSEIARSQTTGMDGRYEIIVDQSINVDYTSFYVEASGYDAISTLGLKDAIHVNTGDKRQVDIQMFSAGTFPLYGYFGSCPDYSCVPYFQIKNRSGNYLSNVEFIVGFDYGGTELLGNTYSTSLNPYESYRYSCTWLSGDRAILTTMGMSKSYLAKGSWKK